LKITASDVNKLRKSTGAGMMDCKKALEESQGDFDKAIEVLRKKGQKVAANRADRDSSEGVVLAKVNSDNTSGIIISLNCETDFVAKNDDYIQLAQKMADQALNFSDKDAFLGSDFDGMKVSEKLLEQTGVIGEKIEIGSFEYISADFVGSYIHAGNKIASIVGLSEKFEGAQDVSKDLSMQIAAMNPLAIDETGLVKMLLKKKLKLLKIN
jgi:elongation factor Ts